MYGDSRFDKVWGGCGTKGFTAEGTEITETGERIGLAAVTCTASAQGVTLLRVNGPFALRHSEKVRRFGIPPKFPIFLSFSICLAPFRPSERSVLNLYR